MPKKSNSGEHQTPKDRIRADLRQIEDRFRAIEALKYELEKGLASGIDPDFSWGQIKERGRGRSG